MPRQPAHTEPFGRSVLIARVAGVDVRLHWSVAGIVALLTWALAASVFPDVAPGHSTVVYSVAAVATSVAFLVTLLMHELAHTLMALRAGQRVTRITLFMLGGLTEMADEPKNARDDAAIAIAGPLTSLILGGAFTVLALTVGSRTGMLHASFAWLAGTNVTLAVFNMMPAFPLDGGRLLSALLWWRWRDRLRSARVAAHLGATLGLFLVWYGLFNVLVGVPMGLWLCMIGLFVMSAARAEEYAVSVKAVGDLTVDEVMTPVSVHAPAWLTVGEFVDTLSAVDSAYPAYVVLDANQSAVGLITWADLEAVPRDGRRTVQVGQAMRQLDRVLTVAGSERLTDLTPRMQKAGWAIVLSGGRPVGTLSMRDIGRAATTNAGEGNEWNNLPHRRSRTALPRP